MNTAKSRPLPEMVTMKLFHRTKKDTAAAILANGFGASKDWAGIEATLKGVWLFDRPLACRATGAYGETLLAVTLTCAEHDLDFYELVEEGKRFREWCIPAAFVNALATVEMVDGDALDWCF